MSIDKCFCWRNNSANYSFLAARVYQFGFLKILKKKNRTDFISNVILFQTLIELYRKDDFDLLGLECG